MILQRYVFRQIALTFLFAFAVVLTFEMESARDMPRNVEEEIEQLTKKLRIAERKGKDDKVKKVGAGSWPVTVEIIRTLF